MIFKRHSIKKNRNKEKKGRRRKKNYDLFALISTLPIVKWYMGGGGVLVAAAAVEVLSWMVCERSHSAATGSSMHRGPFLLFFFVALERLYLMDFISTWSLTTMTTNNPRSTWHPVNRKSRVHRREEAVKGMGLAWLTGVCERMGWRDLKVGLFQNVSVWEDFFIIIFLFLIFGVISR